MSEDKKPTNRRRPAPKRGEKPSVKEQDQQQAPNGPAPETQDDVLQPSRYKAALAEQISKLPERDQIKSAAQARLEKEIYVFSPSKTNICLRRISLSVYLGRGSMYVDLRARAYNFHDKKSKLVRQLRLCTHSLYPDTAVYDTLVR